MTAPGKCCPGERHIGQTPFWRWPVGQGQLYGWEGGSAWLPRITKRECTNGLPWESAVERVGLRGVWCNRGDSTWWWSAFEESQVGYGCERGSVSLVHDEAGAWECKTVGAAGDAPDGGDCGASGVFKRRRSGGERSIGDPAGCPRRKCHRRRTSHCFLGTSAHQVFPRLPNTCLLNKWQAMTRDLVK
jgi:hypothetical protein